ncbi:FtsK/SpoIIIE family DNA translocase [Clostridium thermarum]|uniref:FtsK/SpoIIIE family DNA translocase n=1 Tax=Clostridium thermarum TaxID=1716543 RepID=UPI00111F7838|nr:DNA translocase FtsK [Clostridium thermarum]
MTLAKKKSKSNLHNDIYGVTLVAFGLLTLISVFTLKAGLLGGFIKNILFALIGIGAFLLPLFIIFIGIAMIITKGNLKFEKKFYGILTFVINTILFVQLANIDKFYYGDFVNGLVDVAMSKNFAHGGVLSYIITVPLYKLLGSTGCYILYCTVYIISMMIVFNFTIMDVVGKIKLPRKQKEKKQVLSDVQEVALTEEVVNDKGNYINDINKKIKIIDFMKNNNVEEEGNLLQKAAVSIEKKHNSVGEAKEDISKSISEEIMQNFNDVAAAYSFPSTDLLNINNSLNMNKEDKKGLLNSAAKLEETLSSFGVEAKVIQVTKGPSVTRYELQPSSGVKVSKIVNLSDDIALSLAAKGVRIEAPIPGKAAVGIEVPNKELIPVYLREVLESEEFKNNKNNLSFSLGKDIAGNCVVADLTKMPHLLIAGATGSGKSVCINTLIISLLYKYSPDDVKLLMVDPKVVELSVYNGIPHLLIPVVTDPKKAAGALNWAVNEMTRRYKLFADNSVRNVEGYNELLEKGKVTEKLPWIVIIVDELADLMMVCPGDVENYIGRLAQMARAAGMHLVIATQRPSVDVITGVIKANIPSRISFAVSSQIDSRTILDSTGAEKLLGKGDMLFYPVGEAKPIRIQGAYIGEEEVEKVVNFIKSQQNISEYKEEILNHINSEQEYEEEFDELLDEAIRIVVECDQASTSLLQRRLRIGYNRAARLIDQLEAKGIISARDGSKPRQILVDRNSYLNNEIIGDD